MGEFGEEEMLGRGAYEGELSLRVMFLEAALNAVLANRESVVVLAPMGTHDALAIGAWQSIE